MEPGVPFALLSAAQLLALSAAMGLAAVALASGSALARRTPVVLGALLLATAHALTPTLFGSLTDDRLTILRAAGYFLLALGLSVGALRPPSALPAVAPLAIGPPAVLAAVAAALAAVAALRVRRPSSTLLAVGFVLAGGAELVATRGEGSTGLIAALVLRILWALAVGAFLIQSVRRSVLGKVVAGILAGVLLLAVGAAGVVGSEVAASLERDQRSAAQGVGVGQTEALDDLPDDAVRVASLFSECAVRLRDATACRNVVTSVSSEEQVLLGVVGRGGTVVFLGRRQLAGLEANVLAQSADVRFALRQGVNVATYLVLLGQPPRLLALGVVPIKPPGPPRPVTDVAVYGTVVGDGRMSLIEQQSGYNATIYYDGAVRASSLRGDSAQLDAVTRELEQRDVTTRLAALPADDKSGVTVPADGSRPTVEFRAIRDTAGGVVAVLALSKPSAVVLDTQRRVLRYLFLATLLIGLLVAALAILLGRRIVRPVRELTEAASRVQGGDLSTRAGVRSRDEVGILSRAFDDMTASIAGMTGDLRQAATDEAALRGRLETVLDSIGDGIVTTDGSGRVVAANPAATALLGLSPDESLGRPLGELLALTDTGGTPLAVTPGETVVGVLRSASGRRTPVAVATTALRGGDGQVVVVRDTTRESQVERMKTEFLSNVSHELRTPLTPIRGYAEILRRRPNLSPEKTSAYAETILDSSARMARVVDLLVDVAALEAGRVTPRRAPVSVSDFVDERIAVWREREPGRDFRRRLAAGLPPVLIDRVWLAKAVDELIDNAVKYSDAPDPVTIAAAPSGPHRVRITVRDAGPGIPAEAMETLFTHFEQLDGSSTRSVGGLGLGLSFVRRVADDFGLQLTFDSTVGRGSAFSLDVPVAAGRPPRATPRPRRPAAARPATAPRRSATGPR